MSDHADWGKLNATIQAIARSEVWVTHGRGGALVRRYMTRQIKAGALALPHFEDQDN